MVLEHCNVPRVLSPSMSQKLPILILLRGPQRLRHMPSSVSLCSAPIWFPLSLWIIAHTQSSFFTLLFLFYPSKVELDIISLWKPCLIPWTRRGTPEVSLHVALGLSLLYLLYTVHHYLMTCVLIPLDCELHRVGGTFFLLSPYTQTSGCYTVGTQIIFSE